MTTLLKPGNAVSPIDGRYAAKTAELSEIFSEQALMKYRLIVEVEYLLCLSSFTRIIRRITKKEMDLLHLWCTDFSDADFKRIQKYEKKTNHDVKAVEYFLREKMKKTSLANLVGFVHLGRTSEDINNLAYAIMLRDGTEIIIDGYNDVSNMIMSFAEVHKNTPMLAHTHGQPAVPTTFGWEMNVFYRRICEDISSLKYFALSVKCNGATGGDNALYAAYPNTNWINFSERFIKHLNDFNSGGIEFTHNLYTTQIEPHDTYRRLFDLIKGINTILIDFSQDCWAYISRDVLTQIPVKGEVGSSAMPQKINPINFENAEGNFGLANSMFEFFGRKLPISRQQRDLSDSTVERAFGTAYAHTLVGLKALQAGLRRVYVNKEHLHTELENNWGIIAEAYQVILRVWGIEKGHELLSEVTRGKKVTKESLHLFVDDLHSKKIINKKLIKILKEITPHNYIGNRTF